jgi:hypothetical protein
MKLIKARLQEIIEVHSTKQPQSFAEFFRFSDYCSTHTQDEIYSEMLLSYTNLMNQSQYL